MFAAIFAACICAFTRSVLNVCDRKIFKDQNTDFLKSVLFNSIFPFIVAFSFASIFGEQNRHFFSFLFQPGVILSALGAQLAAYTFSYNFKTMFVKSIVVSSKMADLFIPLSTFLITDQFKLYEYCFSSLSTVIFFPLFLTLLKNKGNAFLLSSLSLISVLLFQSTINSYFSMHKFADTWPKFLSMMTCILLWRTVFMTIPYLIKKIKTRQTQKRENCAQVDYRALILRSILAFVSQAAFFYSITRHSGNIAWPILNSTPLISCLTAHYFLNEKVDSTLVFSGIPLIFLSTFYFFMNWS